jgi:hypothetical protein
LSILPPEVLNQRAEKYNLAMGGFSPGTDKIRETLTMSQEPDLRRQMTQLQSNRDTRTRMGLAMELGKYADADPKLLEAVLQFKGQIANADTVLENEYGRQFMNATATSRMIKNAIETYTAYKPETVMDHMDMGSLIIAKNETYRKLYEDTEAKANNLLPISPYEAYRFTPGMGVLTEVSKYFNIPGSKARGSLLDYMGTPNSWIRMHNAVGDTPMSTSFLPGNNLRENVQYIGMLPADKGLEVARKTINDLWQKNPDDAVKFAKALVSYTASDQKINNDIALVDLMAWVSGPKVFPGEVHPPLPKGTPPRLLAPYTGPKNLREFGQVFDGLRDQEYQQARNDIYPKYADKIMAAARKVDLETRELEYWSAKQAGEVRELAQPPYGIARDNARKNLRNATQEYDTLVSNMNEEITNRLTPRGSVVTVPRDMTAEEIGIAQRGIVTSEQVRNAYLSPVTEFKTGNGGTYRVHDNGTTTSEQIVEKTPVPQPQSAKTVYIDTAKKSWLGKTKDAELRVSDNSIALVRGKDGKQIYPKGNIPYTTEPRVGSAPIELYDQGNHGYKNYRMGANITDITGRKEFTPPVSDRTPNALRAVQEQSDIQDRLENGFIKVRKAMTDATKAAVQGGKLNIDQVLHATGNIPEGAQVSALKEAKNTIDGKPPINMEMFIQRLPTAVNVDPVPIPAANGGQATVQLSEALASQTATLEGAVRGHLSVDRMTDDSLIRGIQQTYAQIANLAPKAENSIVNVRWDTALSRTRLRPDGRGGVITDVSPGNAEKVNYVTVVLGNADKTGFATAERAAFFGQTQLKLNRSRFDIEQQGGAYFITVTKPIDETTRFVREGLAITTGNKSTDHGWNGIFWSAVKGGLNKIGIRSTPYVTSVLNTEARNVVTHATTGLQEIAKSIAENIGSLSKEERNSLRTIIDKDRTMMMPDGRPGRFLHTVGELDAEYLTTIRRLPSDKERYAYFSHQNLSNFDYDIRNLGLRRDFSRMGVEHHRIRYWIPETAEAEAKTAYTSYFFGKPVDRLPYDSGGVYVLDSTNKSTSYHRLYKLGDNETRKQIDNLINNEGHKIIQIANPLEKPVHDELTGHNGDIINFIVAKDTQSQPLPVRLLPYREGGHLVYEASNLVKQAIIGREGGRFNYLGDRTVFGFMSRPEAEKYAANMEKGRLLVKAGDDAALTAHLGPNLPFTLDEFKEKFAKGTWDVHEPFVHVNDKQSVIQAHGAEMEKRFQAQNSELTNEHDSAHNLFQFVDKKYIGEKDQLLWTVKERGSTPPQLETASLLDPYLTLNKTLSSAIHQRLMSDYRMLSVESFVTEFRDLFDARIRKQLDDNPLYWVQNPKWDPSMKTDPRMQLALSQLKGMNYFMDMDSPAVELLKGLQHRMVDTVYNRFGQKWSDKASAWLAGGEKDPAKYARIIAFDAHLGFFNPVQLLKQATTVVHINGVAGPMNGIPGVGAAALSERLWWNPSHLDDFARKFAGTVGWKDTHFVEAYKGAERSGIRLVQGETGWRDDVRDIPIIQRGWNSFIDSGRFFFKTGERFARESAYFTAYREWRSVNPTAMFDDRAQTKVLARANLLNVDMTRAAASPLQQGFGGVITQFFGYQWRMAEQMTGWRLTPVEKARLFATNAAIFGVPVASGAYLGAWPMYDSLKQYALENNLNFNNPVTNTIFEGVLNSALKFTTGLDVNIAQNFGPQGLSTFRQILHGDKAVWNGEFTAAGGTLKDAANTLGPLVHGIAAAMQGKSNEFPFVLQDVIDNSRNLSTLNQAAKAYMGWHYMKYFTKGDTPVADMSKFEAVLMGATGLTPTHIMDTFSKMDSIKVGKATQEKVEPWIKTEIRRAMLASMNNPQEYEAHMKRAMFYIEGGNFSVLDRQRIFREAMQGPMDLEKRVNWEFHFSKTGPQQTPGRMQSYPNQ